MRKVQRYYSLFGTISLGRLILGILVAYFGCVATFAAIYGNFSLVVPAKEVQSETTDLDYIYFSFITQSTVGYGDFRPIGFGRFVVVVQTTIAMLVFSVGAAALVTRLTVPQSNAVEFDNWLVYRPSLNRFQLRFVNRLPVDLVLGQMSFRYRYLRSASKGREKWSRKTVAPLRGAISEMASMYPLAASTATIANFTGGTISDHGEDLVLEPGHIKENVSVIAVLRVTTPTGLSVFTKMWNSDQIECGEFDPTYDDAQVSGVDWGKWGKIIRSESSDCDQCVAKDGCLFRERRQEK